MAAEPTLSVPKDAAAPLPVLPAPLPLTLLFSPREKRWGARGASAWQDLLSGGTLLMAPQGAVSVSLTG